jgi:hypothetical protein
MDIDAAQNHESETAVMLAAASNPLAMQLFWEPQALRDIPYGNHLNFPR